MKHKPRGQVCQFRNAECGFRNVASANLCVRPAKDGRQKSWTTKAQRTQRKSNKKEFKAPEARGRGQNWQRPKKWITKTRNPKSTKCSEMFFVFLFFRDFVMEVFYSTLDVECWCSFFNQGMEDRRFETDKSDNFWSGLDPPLRLKDTKGLILS